MFCSNVKTSVKKNKRKKTIKKNQGYYKLFSCFGVSSISTVQFCMTLSKYYYREVAQFWSDMFSSIFMPVELHTAENGVSVTIGENSPLSYNAICI